MHERALRTVLLIQAIEETDRAGDVLPLADRVEATRAVVGEGPPADIQAEAPLSSASEWLLMRRADLLVQKLRARSPVVDHVLAVAGGFTWLDRVILVLAFVLGVALALLEGSRISIFAFPLIVVMAWNLFVYAVLIARALKTPREGSRPSFWFGGVYARWVRSRLDTLLQHSMRFNAPLAPGLRRFVADWWEVAQPLFVLRARRLLHLAAALVALGLVAALYIRGFVLRQPAGWQSTFLGPQSARSLLVALYGPASAFSGIAIPSSEEIGALRWTGPSAGGGAATDWIHLMARTAVLYVVLPRLLAALVSTLALWRLSRWLAIPSGLSGYVRTLLASARAGGV
jgi:hypothetical protein